MREPGHHPRALAGTRSVRRYEQVRSVAAALVGDWEAVRNVEMVGVFPERSLLLFVEAAACSAAQ